MSYELLCPVHKRATVNARCHDCLAEAADATYLVEEGVAQARAWAATILHRYPSKPLKARRAA